MNWRRYVFLFHRWSGIVLGLIVFSWFASGIAMMYYRWPLITESRQLALLEPFDLASLDTPTVGFRKAAALDAHATGAGGRLLRRDGRLLYDLREDYRDGHIEPFGVVDARSGRQLTPLDMQQAIAFARTVGGSRTWIREAELLDRGDRYMMSGEYARYFPAYRVRFDDDGGTAAYVSRDRGAVFGHV